MHRLPALLLAVLLLLLLAGCGGEDEPKADPTVPAGTGAPAVPTEVAGVSGRLLAVGGPSGAQPRPLAGTVVLRGPGGSNVRAELGDDGRYEIQVPPGDYRITGRSASSQGGRADCATDPMVTTLQAGKQTTADVLCPER